MAGSAASGSAVDTRSVCRRLATRPDRDRLNARVAQTPSQRSGPPWQFGSFVLRTSRRLGRAEGFSRRGGSGTAESCALTMRGEGGGGPDVLVPTRPLRARMEHPAGFANQVRCATTLLDNYRYETPHSAGFRIRPVGPWQNLVAESGGFEPPIELLIL